MDERRVASVEMVLIELGKLQQMGIDMKNSVDRVEEKVMFQNGRVKELELFGERIKGQVDILKVMAIPPLLYVVYLVLNFVSEKVLA